MVFRIFILLIILIVIVLLVRWLLKRISYFKSRPNLLNVFSGILGIIIIIITATSFYYNITKVHQIKFDEIVWINNIEERHKMIDNLLESDYFIGKNVNKIKEVFGVPKKVNPEKNIIIYEIYGKSYLKIKVVTVELNFKNGVVQKFSYNTKID